MSTLVKFFKVTTLPVTPVADAFYFVVNGTYAESYLTDSTGTAKLIGNTTMIEDLIADNAVNSLEIVADITARDALVLTRNTIVLVLDATDDVTVTTGAATYAYRHSDTSFTKIAEYESMDLILQWDNIQGKPTSTPAQIDQAVTDSHTHANKTVLDLLSEDGDGDLAYDGVKVSSVWQEAAW